MPEDALQHQPSVVTIWVLKQFVLTSLKDVGMILLQLPQQFALIELVLMTLLQPLMQLVFNS